MVSILKFLNDFDHSYVNVDQSVSLSVYRSKNKNNFPKVLFFPGFISTLYSWRYFIPLLIKNTELIYVESREKKSSKIKNNQKFISLSMSDFSRDINVLVKTFISPGENYFLVGSSLNATAILESLTF
jgi:hypothetical protein